MIKNLTTVVLLIASAATLAMGQITTPQPSPAATVTQTIGLTEVTVEYSRPGVKGRAIFGDLVPFDQVWRTGANSATKITFSEDVTVEGQELAAGSYAILTKPGASKWDVHFYKYEGRSWGSYVEKTPTVVASVAAIQLPSGMKMENFNILFDQLTNNGGNLEMIWDGTVVPVSIGVKTHDAVMADINKTLAGPSANDYYAAGAYLLDADQDLEKALMYVQKATHGDNPRFWQVRREAVLLGKLGRKAEAIAAAQKSLSLAKEAGNEDYVRLNEKSIKEWSM